jgi:spermidine/putrescine-binding protein
MKNLFRLLVVVVLVIIGMLVFQKANAPSKELNVLIWDNYLAPDTIANFEKQTDATVIVELFKSNEEALAKIKANPGVYDIAVPSDYMVEILKNEKLIQRLDRSQIPNIKDIAESAKGHYYDPNFAVSVPYAFGSAGFAVNTKFVQDTTLTWKILTEPRFKGHIVLMDDMRYVLGSVLLELGLDPNTRKKEDIDQAVALLKEVMPNVQKITPDTPVDLMVADGAWVAYGYSGDSYQMHDGNPAITYLLPTYGGMKFFDNIVIPADAPNLSLAHAFINYILEAKVSADITNATHYGNPVSTAFPLIDEAVRTNPSAFPPEDIMKKLHLVQDVGDDVALYDDAWQKMKQ